VEEAKLISQLLTSLLLESVLLVGLLLVSLLLLSLLLLSMLLISLLLVSLLLISLLLREPVTYQWPWTSILHISAKMRVEIGGSQPLPLHTGRLPAMPPPLDRERILVSLALAHARPPTCIWNPP
jgi:hypothetical protein